MQGGPEHNAHCLQCRRVLSWWATRSRLWHEEEKNWVEKDPIVKAPSHQRPPHPWQLGFTVFHGVRLLVK